MKFVFHEKYPGILKNIHRILSFKNTGFILFICFVYFNAETLPSSYDILEIKTRPQANH